MQDLLCIELTKYLLKNLRGIFHCFLSGTEEVNVVVWNQLACQYSSDTEEKSDKDNDENGSSDKQKTGTNTFLI